MMNGTQSNALTGEMPLSANGGRPSVRRGRPIVTPYDDAVRREAIRQGVDPNYAVAVMHQESAGDPNAVSGAGAEGLMQLMPATAAGLGVSNPLDPAQNIRGGVNYLSQGINAYGGNFANAAARYNAGPAPSHWDNPQTNNYVNDVASRYMLLTAGSGDPSKIAESAANFYPKRVAPVDAQAVDTSALDELFAPKEAAPASPGAQQGSPEEVDTSALDALFAPKPQSKPKPVPKTIAGTPDLTKSPSLLQDFGIGAQDVAQPIENGAQNAAAWLTRLIGARGATKAIRNNQAAVNAQIEADRAKAEPGIGGQIARGVGQVAVAAPILTAGGEVAGAGMRAAGDAIGGTTGNLLTKGAGLVTGAGGKTALGRTAALSANGALQGAGFNALTGRDPMAGAGVGAAFGPLAYGAGKVAGAVGSKVADAFRSPESAARGQILNAIGADRMTPEQVVQNMRDMGSPATAADAGGQNLMRKADSAIVAGGPAAEEARVAMAQRAEERIARLTSGVTDATGQNKDVYGTIDALMKQRSADAGPLYEKLGSIQPNQEQLAPLMTYIESPRGQAAMQDGIKILQDEALKDGQTFDPAMFGLVTKPDGTLSIQPGANSFPLLQAVKEGLDDMVEGGSRSLGGKALRALTGVRNSYRDQLTKTFPDYKAALDAWAGPSSAMDAVNLGRKALSADPEVTEKTVSGLTDSQKEFFLQGVTRGILDKMETNPNRTVGQILNNRVLQAKIKAAFPSADAFNGFMQRLKTEAEMMKREQLFNRGSPTASRQVDQANLLNRAHAATHAVGNALTGHIGPAIANGARAVSTFGPNPEVSDALGRTLLSDNPDYVQSVLLPQRSARQEGFKRAGELANLLTRGAARAGRNYGPEELQGPQ